MEEQSKQNNQGIEVGREELIETIKRAVAEERSNEALVLQHPGGARCEISSGCKTIEELFSLGHTAINKLNTSSTKHNGMPGVN